MSNSNSKTITVFKIIALIAAAFALLSVGFSALYIAFKDKKVDEEYTPSIEELCDSCVLIRIYDSEDVWRYTASAVYIGNNLFITARHNTEDAAYYEALGEDSEVVRIDEIVYVSDENTDFAILRAWEDVDWPPLTLGDSETLERGETLYSISSPYNCLNRVTQGIYEGESDQYITHNCYVYGGSSGGALINEAGELVGIIQGVHDGGEAKMFTAVPINDIKDALKEIEPDLVF